jgi:pimeloyl-ACP methyl ester carboxylesterase
MISVRCSDERGGGKMGWLDSQHTFSFGHYHDPRHMGFRPLQIWLLPEKAGFKAAFDCIKAVSETDFTQDMKKIDMPTLIVHGDDDRSSPSARPPGCRRS